MAVILALSSRSSANHGEEGRENHAGKTASWKNIMKDDRFDHLLTYVEHPSKDEDEDKRKDKQGKGKPAPPERAKPSAPNKAAPAKAGTTFSTRIAQIFKTSKPSPKLALIFKASVLAVASTIPARNKAKKRGGLNSSRYGSLVRPPPATQVPSREALRKDRLGIFLLVALLNNLAKERL